jgi:hypothetical protein
VEINKYDKKLKVESKKLLHNGIKFSGKVISFKQSNNHAFGVILLKLSSEENRIFIKPDANKEFPYRLYHDYAELYTQIPDGINVGDVVSVDSNKESFTYKFLSSNQKYEGYISVINDPIDIEFISNHTMIDSNTLKKKN